jgi:acyl-CoA synthetase (AMP-forming)/AMP-acid ligase II
VKSLLPEFKTLIEAMEYHSHTTPEKVAVVMVNSLTDEALNTRISYAGLQASAIALAGVLNEKFEAGSRILLPTVVSEYFVVAFLACSYARMIAVPTPLPSQYDHQKQRLSNIVKDCEVSAIFHAPADKSVLEDWVSTGLHGLPLIEISVINTNSPVQNLLSTPASSELALLQYTSGSTGNPKGVMLSHANLVSNVIAFKNTLQFSDSTTFGGWIPQYHDMGLMAQVLPPLFLGSCCYMMTPNQFLRRPVFWLKMLSQYKINHTCAPNFAFDLCRKQVPASELPNLDLSHLRYLINGSEPIQADTINAFRDAFSSAGFSAEAMQPCYGMAECTVFISGAPPRKPGLLKADRDGLQKHIVKLNAQSGHGQTLVSCGFALDYDVRIVNPESNSQMANGEIGEIWLQGKSVALGYWNKPSDTASTFHAHLNNGEGPFLRTGDLGFLWQGEIFITGRLKEVIIVNGKNIYPQDIEHGVRQKFPELGNKFGAAFGIHLDNLQETIGICHELQGSFSEEALISLSENIRSWVNREWGAPVSSVVLLYPGDVNRTTSGKIQRNKIRERFFQQSLKSRYQWLSEPLAAQLGASAVNSDQVEEEPVA